ncbi:MAG: antibiotic biosynthesis monooxygenase [Fusobacteriaceae bacterium]|jgi:quinol monooxygenase YgiN|nr:antibiotic biosynthesis monooxygenase [Fusobacteriaceae bacterium]
MIRVVAKNFLIPEKTSAAAPFFSELISATRKEEGCIEYRLFINSKVNTEYVFIEEWISQEALDKHMNSEHFKRLIPHIKEFCSKEKEVMILEEFVSK